MKDSAAQDNTVAAEVDGYLKWIKGRCSTSGGRNIPPRLPKASIRPCIFSAGFGRSPRLTCGFYMKILSRSRPLASYALRTCGQDWLSYNMCACALPSWHAAIEHQSRPQARHGKLSACVTCAWLTQPPASQLDK